MSPMLEQSLLNPRHEWFRGALLGKGGFGSVHIGWAKTPDMFDHVFPNYFAVKSTLWSESVELQRESIILSEFQDCPFIIRRYGEDVTAAAGGKKNKKMFNLFLEYAEGGTIGDLIKREGGSGLREPQVREYTESILKGLEYIHEQGYVHCDLKPANILLVSKAADNDSYGDSEDVLVPKIGDFGIVKGQGMMKSYGGTKIYMSPEAVIEKIQEAPSDIWSLGCVVLEMLTGRRPWDLKPRENIKDRIGSEIPRIPDWLSEEAKDFLGKCFERNTSERFTASELLNHPFVTNKLRKVATLYSAPSLEAGALKSQKKRWKNFLSSRFFALPSSCTNQMDYSRPPVIPSIFPVKPSDQSAIIGAA